MAAAPRGLVLSRPVTFVTGNAKKLEEVRAILGNSIPFKSLKLDRKCGRSWLFFSIFPFFFLFQIWFAVPELQGEPEDISKEKARIAAKEVLILKSLSLSLHGWIDWN